MVLVEHTYSFSSNECSIAVDNIVQINKFIPNSFLQTDRKRPIREPCFHFQHPPLMIHVLLRHLKI